MRRPLRNLVSHLPLTDVLSGCLLRRVLPVFMLHRVVPAGTACYDPEMNTPPEVLDQFIAWLKESFEVLPLEDCLKLKTSGRKTKKRVCAITFDDGWRDNFEFAYPILKKHGIAGTIFLATGFIGTQRRFWQDRLWQTISAVNAAHDEDSVAEKLWKSIPWCPRLTAGDLRFSHLKALLMRQSSRDAEQFVTQLEELGGATGSGDERAFLNWNELRQMQTNGISFGSHTVNHVLLTCAAPATSQQEIEGSRNQLREQLGQDIAYFSYPWGSVFGHVRRQVASGGYRYACVAQMAYHGRPQDPFLISRIPVSGPLLAGTDGLFDRHESIVSFGISALRSSKHAIRQADTDGAIRLAFVIDSIDGWDAGGTETQIGNVLAALDRNHFQPKLFFLYPSPRLSIDQFPCPVFVARRGSLLKRLSMIASLARGLREFRPHLVQTFFRDGTLFGTSAAKLAGVPCVVQSVRNLGYWMNWIDRVLQPFVQSMSTALHCNSRTIYGRLRRSPGSKLPAIDILPNFLDPKRFSPASQTERSALRKQLGIPEGQPVIVSVANMTPIKDHATLINAARLTRTALPSAYFILVGDGPLYGAIAKQIQQLGLESAVKLVGSQLHVRQWLAVADIGVLTSGSEGCSNSVLEYMGMGLPSIVTDIPANRELVDGVFYSVGDACGLANKIVSLWNSPSERQKLSSQYELLAMQYASGAFLERVQGFYIRTVAGVVHGSQV